MYIIYIYIYISQKQPLCVTLKFALGIFNRTPREYDRNWLFTATTVHVIDLPPVYNVPDERRIRRGAHPL